MNWKEHFVPVGKGRWNCRLCGVNLDARGGRTAAHLRVAHQDVVDDSEAGSPGSETAEQAPALGAAAAPGSRDWAIRQIIEIIANPASTSTDKTRCLDLLKEYEQFDAAGRYDDEEERRKHMEQWDRAILRGRELMDLARSLLRDPTIRANIQRDLGAA